MANSTQAQERPIRLEDSIKSSITYKTSNRQNKLIIESCASLNNIPLHDSENHKKKEDMFSKKEIIATAVSVNLTDCMKCYVKIPDFKVNENQLGIQSNMRVELSEEIREFREEQEKSSIKKESNQILLKEEPCAYQRGLYCADPYLEDCNPMNTAIIIDLPWPPTPEQH